MIVAWIIAMAALALAGVMAWLFSRAQARARRLERDTAQIKAALTMRIDRALQLRESLLNAVDDPMLVLDAEQRVLFANTAAVGMVGSDPVGQTLLAAVRQPELESIIDDARRVRGEPVVRRVEMERRIYEARATVFEDDTSAFEILYIRDVTEFQRLERARREMVSNISHDLSTPITAIGLLADTLIDLASKRLSKKAVKMAADIRREADTLTQLVQEMRDLSLIESGQMLVRMMPTDLQVIVKSAVAQLLALAENNDQDIVLNVPPDIEVLADEVQAQRALKNIIHNAVKYSPSGSTIEISASVVEDEAQIAVKDQGPGIASEDQPRIFERFFQVDRARRAGTGLGLAIVRHIVMAHGGRVWVESEVGHGSTFFITLALSDDMLIKPSPEAKPVMQGRPDLSAEAFVVRPDAAPVSNNGTGVTDPAPEIAEAPPIPTPLPDVPQPDAPDADPLAAEKPVSLEKNFGREDLLGAT